MIFYLSFLVCLGHSCMTVTDPNAAQFPNKSACEYMGQLVAARWIGDHPDYVLGKITCSSAKPV
jgi:hypothetical protein